MWDGDLLVEEAHTKLIAELRPEFVNPGRMFFVEQRDYSAGGHGRILFSFCANAITVTGNRDFAKPTIMLDSLLMSRDVEESNRWMLRARDAMDRAYDQPLDVAALAQIACVSEAHFIRTFRTTFGETPHRYLQRRRVERSMFLLRESDRSVTDICLAVGFTSLGTFSRTFREIIGQSPLAYRRRSAPVKGAVPTCFTMAWARPSSFGEANQPARE